MATRFKSVIAFLALALAMGCVAPTPLPTAAPEPFITRQLDVKIDPKEAASYLLNPSPLGKSGYSKGMIVTIDILPQQGWQVDKWIGPVFNVDGTTAKIEMDSSQSIAVRLKPTTPPTATPTDTPIPPTDTPVPTPTPTSEPTATPRPTYAPFPTYTPFPTPTATPRPTYTPRATPTARVIFVTPTPTPTRRPTPTLNSAYYFNKGYDEIRDGKYESAISSYTIGIQLNPTGSSAYSNSRGYSALGFSHAALGQFQRAILDYNYSIRLDPRNATTDYNRGNTYGKLGNYRKEAHDKAKACSLDSKYC